MDQSIHISQNISSLRKAQGLTQDDVAAYLGVTKASVSKWECAQSFPDLTLIPKLATYFGVTIDSLMGYQPQMSKEAIRRTYLDLRGRFATESFDEVHDACKQIIHDYWSCAALLVQMAVLYLNHLPLAASCGQQESVMEEAVGLCRRARSIADDAFQIRQATAVEAMYELSMGRAQQAQELLGGAAEPSMGEQVLLVQALLAQGKTEEALQLSQVNVYQGLIGLLNDLPQLAAQNVSDPARLSEIWRRTKLLIQAFNLEVAYVNCAAVYLQYAAAFAQVGEQATMYECLADYVRVCGAMTFPLKLTADDFFDKIGPWLKNLDLGDNAPRNEELIRQSMIDGLEQNPVFASIKDDAKFKALVVDLKGRIS